MKIVWHFRVGTRQTQNSFITFIQRRTNVLLYTCCTDVLCLLGKGLTVQVPRPKLKCTCQVTPIFCFEIYVNIRIFRETTVKNN